MNTDERRWKLNLRGSESQSSVSHAIVNRARSESTVPCVWGVAAAMVVVTAMVAGGAFGGLRMSGWNPIGGVVGGIVGGIIAAVESLC